jgi:hypothetical protein
MKENSFRSYIDTTVQIKNLEISIPYCLYSSVFLLMTIEKGFKKYFKNTISINKIT